MSDKVVFSKEEFGELLKDLDNLELLTKVHNADLAGS